MTVPASHGLVPRLRASFDAGRTRPIGWRLEQLGGLVRLLAEHEEDLLGALALDLGRPAFEGYLSDVAVVTNEVEHLARGLGSWSRPERVRLPLTLRPGKARIVREPRGVVLVVGAWNYPVQLLLVPAAAAIAAGNCVILKPSERAPATSATLARLVARYLDPSAIAVLEGGPSVVEDCLAARVDHLFYTGGARVGRVLAQAAARDLIPVTLELGGKSPAIVAADADLLVAARRIVWGRFLNAGQTCVAPDYVLVEESVAERFIALVVDATRRFFGADPRQSPDYGRIVDEEHLDQLAGLLRTHGGRAVIGGEVDRSRRYIAPTVLVEVDLDSPVMTEEIFGPILPVVAVADLAGALDVVRGRPDPLACYLFSASRTTIDRLIDGTRSGGVCVNGTVLQFVAPGLPFGGIGASGIGTYHGRHGYETFSHRRAVLERHPHPDLPLLYPPSRPWKSRLLRALLKLARS